MHQRQIGQINRRQLAAKGVANAVTALLYRKVGVKTAAKMQDRFGIAAALTAATPCHIGQWIGGAPGGLRVG